MSKRDETRKVQTDATVTVFGCDAGCGTEVELSGDRMDEADQKPSMPPAPGWVSYMHGLESMMWSRDGKHLCPKCASERLPR